MFVINCETLNIFQADILHVKSDADVVVFYRVKHGTGRSFHYYGTPGLGEEFVRGNSDFAPTVRDMFEAFSVQYGENLMFLASVNFAKFQLLFIFSDIS